MTIVQLEYFLAVVRCGSFSKAAEKCFVTQPSLSMQVKALEEELGVTLLDRSRQPVTMTEIGSIIFDQAKRAIDEFNLIHETVGQIKGEISGKVRLAAIPTIAPYLLHKLVPEFISRYPEVELEIHEMKTEAIAHAIETDDIDIAIVAGGTLHKGVIEQHLFNDPFYVYVSPELPLMKRRNISISEIDTASLVMLSPGNCMRDQVMDLCRTAGADRSHDASSSGRYYFESGSLETLMRIVDGTPSLTIIPQMSLEYVPEEHRDQIKRLEAGTHYREITMVTRRTFVKKSISEAMYHTALELFV